MPDLAEDSSGESEDDDKPAEKRQKYPTHQPRAPFDAKPSAPHNAADDDDDDLPELLDGGSDEEDDDEPPPLVGESSGEEDESDDERGKGRGNNKTKTDGPTLPGLKAGFFAKPKPPPQPAPPLTPAAASKTPPAPATAPPQGPSAFNFNFAPKPAAKAAPPPAAKEAPPPTAKAAPPPAARAAPHPAAKPPPRQKDGEVEEASDGNDSDEVPDLLEADDEDEDSGSEPPESEPEQESDEEEYARPAYGTQRGAPRKGSFYPDFESEERALEERRKREVERKRKEEERARERAERKRREQEEKKRRQAEAKKRQMEDAAVYANSPEARELAEQARLRAEAEMEEKRLQMGLGPREKTSNAGEEEIGPAYFCRGTHCPGNQRMLTKTQEYIEFRCTERCLLLYHTGDCHRKDVKLKMEREHGVWKEEEGAPCITPDCPGTLTKGTKWNRFGKVSYQIIDPEKYEKKRREKERLRAEEKAAKQAAKAAMAAKRSKKQERHHEEELEGFAKFRRSAKSRTFTNFSFQGATQAVAAEPAAEPIPEEAPAEAKEGKAEAEDAPRKRGKKKNAEGGAPAAEANGGDSGAGPSGGHEEGSGGGGTPGIAVLVKAPPRPAVEREPEDVEVMEYRKKEDEGNVFTLGNRDRSLDKGKQKVDAVPEPPSGAAAKGKGKKKGMTLSINEFITSDDPDPALRPQGPPSASRPFFADPARPFMNGDYWRGPPQGPPMHGPIPVVYRQPQEDFPELHRGPGGMATTPSAPGFQEPPKDPFTLALDSIRIRDSEPTRHLVLEDVDGRAEDEDIRSLLWEFGMVEEMTRFRGRELAFVTMRTVEEAATARLLLPNRSLKNRRVKLDSVRLHPSPSFFANYQPRWAAHDLITPRTSRPSPLAPPFVPGEAGPSYQSLDGSEQWEEFEWSATGEDAFAASASDWGSEAPVGSFGSFGDSALRTAAAKGKMKPDAPEFVPKSVLLAQTKKEPAAGLQTAAQSEAKPETSGARGESSGSGPSGSAGGSASPAEPEEATKRPATAPKDGREAATGAAAEKEAAERPASAPLRATKMGSALEESRPTSTPKAAQPDAGTEERPASAPTADLPKRNGATTEALDRGGSLSKMESARDALAAGRSAREALTSGGERLDAARSVLARVEPGRSLLGSGSGRLESARDLLGSGGATRPRSTSPVVPLPPSLQAVQAGRLPLLTRQCNYAMGQIIATTTETLALYQDSIRLDKGYFVPGCQIMPHACALFLFNIEELELHGFYESTSGSYLQCRDPYTGIMYGVEQPHIAFRRVCRWPVPLGRTEIEPLLPPGCWNADTWHLPLVLPAVQTEMLLLLFADKAEYEERKKRGFAEELEGQLEIAQAAARPHTPPLPSGIPPPTPANAVVAVQSPRTTEAPTEEAPLSATAAVPATIAAAAARAVAENGNGAKAANGKVAESGEGSGSEDVKSNIAGASSGVAEKAPVASADGLQGATEDRSASVASDEAGGSDAAKAEANDPPKAAPARPTSPGTAKEPAAKPGSPSSPLSPQPSPSPPRETETSRPGAPGDITTILAEITSAASGCGGEGHNTQPAAPFPPKTAPATPRSSPPHTSRPGVQPEERIPTPLKREGARPASWGEAWEAEERSTSLATETGGPSAAEAAAPNMQSILDMLLPKAAAPAPGAAPAVSAPAAVRPYRPPVRYNPLGQAPLQAPSSNGRVLTPPARESPPLVDERTACKLCWVRKADFFIKECGHMGPCLSCFEDPRIDSNHCPQCRRKIAAGDPTKFIRMFR